MPSCEQREVYFITWWHGIGVLQWLRPWVLVIYAFKSLEWAGQLRARTESSDSTDFSKGWTFPAVTYVSLGKLHLAAISSNKHYVLCFVFVVVVLIILRKRSLLSQNMSLWMAEVVTNHIMSTRGSSLLLAWSPFSWPLWDSLSSSLLLEEMI